MYNITVVCFPKKLFVPYDKCHTYEVCHILLAHVWNDLVNQVTEHIYKVQGGSNMTGTDFFVNKPHCDVQVSVW
jgi:hypothetical protein